jgi:hypothetical protein
MKEQLISFSLAKLAKDKGFKPINPSTSYVPMFIDSILTDGQEEDYNRDNFYLALTQSLLQKWLREVHKIDVEIQRSGEINASRDGFKYSIYGESSWDYSDIVFKIYEEALEKGLLEALKLIKI